MSTDSVADALIRIKNGYLARKDEVSLSYSKLVNSICSLLKNEGYIAGFSLDKNEPGSSANKIAVTLKYEGRKPVLMDVQRISKPGLRIYKGNKELPWVLNGMGIAIISTPKGVMTDKQARKEGVGGEVMAYVW